MKKFLILMAAMSLSLPAAARVCVKTEMTLDAIYNAMYPVGSIYSSTVNKNPNDLLGFGEWERFGQGKTLVGLDETDAEFDAAEKTGGTKTHRLTESEMPRHTHIQNQHRHSITTSDNDDRGSYNDVGAGTHYTNQSGYTTAVNQYAGGEGTDQAAGDGAAHNNLQPYIIVYMWRRIS